VRSWTLIGIANRESIAYGCAKALKHYGADLAITYLNDKARPHVEPVAAGLKEFDELLAEATRRAPAHQLASIQDVGIATAALATEAARLITGESIYIDGGFHIMG